MRDAFIVFRKEAKEMTGDRSSLRGTLTQALVVVAVCGLFVPFKTPEILESVEASVMLFIVFPMTLAAAVAADAFAGERERGTLETLFASPLSESDPFLGKTGFAAAVTFIISCITIACALVTISTTGGTQSTYLVRMLTALLGGSLAGGALMAALVALISLKVKAARSAQQIGSVLSLGLAFGASFGIHKFWAGLSWKLVQIGDVVTAGIAFVAITVGVVIFKHSRLLSDR